MPRVLALTVTTLALLACTGVTPLDSDTDTAVNTDIARDGCLVAGQGQANSADVGFQQLLVNGITEYAVVEPNAVYDGVPSVCVDAAGKNAVITFISGTAPYGTLTLHVDGVGTTAMSASTDHVALDLFGADIPVVYNAGSQWTDGTLEVNTVDPLGFGLSGAASRSGQTTYIEMTGTIQP